MLVGVLEEPEVLLIARFSAPSTNNNRKNYLLVESGQLAQPEPGCFYKGTAYQRKFNNLARRKFFKKRYRHWRRFIQHNAGAFGTSRAPHLQLPT